MRSIINVKCCFVDCAVIVIIKIKCKKMVNKCIVFGCTTGYVSNPEKLQTFSVPKDKKLRKSWEIAINRANFQIKSTQVVCIKHFLPEDLLSERFLLGPDCSILGKVRKLIYL